ncbi:MAG TPA: ABC transporter permease [Trebonia sp.]|jgi:peptide/nickel transport system permease protein|nr:ABC transporter permease [Trebonia sp.]
MTATAPVRATPSRGLYRRVAGQLVRNPAAMISLGVLVAVIVFCFLGPFFYHTDQIHVNLAAKDLPPGTGHPLGTDDVGHDILGRLMFGGQTSLEIGVAAGVIATVIGMLWGAVAGYAGGWTDAVMMRVVDAGIAVPALFLLLVAATILTPTIPVLIVIIGVVSWLVPARLVRAEAVSLRTREYVQAMIAMGGGSRRAVFRHIIPNVVGTVVVNATFQVADAIMLVAYLSFLGLGVPLPRTDWGGILAGGLNYALDGYWWMIVPAGVAIVIVVCAFNFIGDGLRDAFEVRLRGR